MKKQVGMVLFLAWATVFCFAASAQAVKFRYENLGTLGGNQSYTNFPFKEAGINDAGQVVGYSFTAGGEKHAFIKSPGQAMVDLGLISGGDESHALCINNSGVIGGFYLDSTGKHACLWVPAGGQYQMQPLDLGSSSSEIHGINDAGYVVGMATVQGSPHAVVVPPGGAPQDLGTLPPDHLASYAMSINNANIIVGSSSLYESGSWGSLPAPNACVWSPSGESWAQPAPLFALIFSFGLSDSNAFAINDSGQTVGCWYVAPDASSTILKSIDPVGPHALLQSPGQAWLNLEGQQSGWNSIAYDINDSGWVVG